MCCSQCLWFSVFVVDLLRVVGYVSCLRGAHGTLEDIVARVVQSRKRERGGVRKIRDSVLDHRVNLETKATTCYCIYCCTRYQV